MGPEPPSGGVQVMFNNIPGTPIYVSATQINVTVPWEINGQPSANVVVTYNGNSSAPTNVSVNSVAPGPTATPLFLDGKDQESIDHLANLAPVERLGMPADIAEVAGEGKPAGAKASLPPRP